MLFSLYKYQRYIHHSFPGSVRRTGSNDATNSVGHVTGSGEGTKRDGHVTRGMRGAGSGDIQRAMAM